MREEKVGVFDPPQTPWIHHERRVYKGNVVPQSIVHCVCGKEYGLIYADGRPMSISGLGDTVSTCSCGRRNCV